MLLVISPSDTHTHSPASTAACFCQHCTMSRFWQLFWPALARKAGQRDPQTLVGGLGAHHGTSRSKFRQEVFTIRNDTGTQAAFACDKWHPCTYSTSIFSKVAAACTPSSARAMHQRGTLTQPLHCDLQRVSCKTQLQNKVSVPKRNKNDSLRFTTLSCKRQKYYTKSRSCEEPWCSHYNAFSSISWQTRMSRHALQQNVTTIM